MERPSHSIAALSLQTGSRRFAGVSLALLTQLSFGAILVGGVVVRSNIAPPPDLTVAQVKEDQVRTPLPPVKLEKPAMPTAVEPAIVITQETSGPSITTVPPQPLATVPATRQPPPVPPATTPDRAATGIAETHTAPPYPTLARRLGAQGKVTLRLSVQADGSVGRAEVVTSSGRPDLDQAAVQWITGHWTYRPAIRGGVPAAAQVMAAVDFNLSDAR